MDSPKGQIPKQAFFWKKHIPKGAHSKKCTFLKEQIPKRAYSEKGTFQKGHIPKKAHSKNGTSIPNVRRYSIYHKGVAYFWPFLSKCFWYSMGWMHDVFSRYTYFHIDVNNKSRDRDHTYSAPLSSEQLRLELQNQRHWNRASNAKKNPTWHA